VEQGGIVIPNLPNAIAATIIAAIFLSAASAQQPQKTVIRNATISATARLTVPSYSGSLEVFKGTGTGGWGLHTPGPLQLPS
jgi:hypothetical protein